MSREREDRPEGAEARRDAGPEYKCFVGGISWHLKDEDLKDMFRKCDPKDAFVMVDKNTGRSRGFGFVLFKDEQGMDDAVRKFHDTEYEGRKISVRRAIPQDQTAPGTPAAALAAGRRYDRTERGGSRADRGGYRAGAGYERGGYDRYERGYDRGAYERAGYRAYDRPYERPPYEGYDRGYPPAAYGYDSRAADPYGYSREYPPRDPYAADHRYAGYAADPYAYDRSGYPPAAYPDRYAAERAAYPPPADRAAAPAGADRYRSGGPEREYGARYGGASARPGPYDRAPVGARDDADRRAGSR